MLQPTERRLSIVRKYFFEFVVVCLIASVVKLFMMYIDMNTFVRDKLFDNTVKMETIIERNTDVLNFKNNLK